MEWSDKGGGKLTYIPKLKKDQCKEIKIEDKEEKTIKTHIFRYQSWKGKTNFIIDNDNISDIDFVYEIKLDSSAEEDIVQLKKEINDKEKSEGNRIEFEDIFDVPNLKKKAFGIREKNYNK